MAIGTTVGEATYRGRGGVHHSQGRGGQDVRPKLAILAWISQVVWKLADQITALQREGRASARLVRKACHEFQRALQDDRRQRVLAAGGNIEGILEAGRFKEACYHLAW